MAIIAGSLGYSATVGLLLAIGLDMVLITAIVVAIVCIVMQVRANSYNRWTATEPAP